MERGKGIRLALLALAAALVAGTAQAAGGHHNVDDAAILPRGECEQESWFTRIDGGRQRLHAGVNCRVGPVELGLAGEHGRLGGEPSRTFWGVEVKWARELAEGFSIGFDLSPVAQSNAHPRYAGTSAYAIATWQPRADLALHANYGRDFEHGAADEPRGGLALEWSPVPRWSFVLERYREQGGHFVRAGARWAAGRNWTIDLSRAQKIAGPQGSNWTIGVAFDLDDD
ncbi:hypothetical protein LZ009_23265 [Ramlibacter sp. XY19]|uniref:hypothetical protein n=1 Tax=Ramlibacter paludis TaxID=2908000 RepID=UPI0023DA2088|nr:hypothetical protein [Ramlibacter paludis]MCG2595708.1 hypothetical protein [Ramlibacter paludis]